MAQTKALNALEPFMALTKSASAPRAAADLITQATSNPNTFVFAELLHAPQIQALAESSEYSSHLKLLEIFSYGTYHDHTSATDLPALNEQQIRKLRQLSLLTLAKSPHNLSYASLQRELGITDDRTLEELVISAIYAGLLDAQLDARNRTVHISSVSPLRDLAPGAIPSVLDSLSTWSARCGSTLDELETEIASIKATAAQRHADKKAWAAVEEKLAQDVRTEDQGYVHGRNQPNMINRAVQHLRGQRYGKRGSVEANVGDEDEEPMDVDDEDVYDEGDANGNGKKRASRRKL
ncbi:COP9 signalosome complex subunit 7A [Microdochium trichocladiopsis]|uniref:COP9 signalosome complex subunit 7A n=1 Tax=Microdochium trichocladiopsis TaxID=1682393 RepID=A0A9P8Y2C0_9PEZI|nr:COP9 signalosome complex subunit 7A [Microdochium trichocladiopsis]KAH7027574.1 COP9 signalosome complex subunit 7A [Microdochium trichocladiopsis]